MAVKRYQGQGPETGEGTFATLAVDVYKVSRETCPELRGLIKRVILTNEPNQILQFFSINHSFALQKRGHHSSRIFFGEQRSLIHFWKDLERQGSVFAFSKLSAATVSM